MMRRNLRGRPSNWQWNQTGSSAAPIPNLYFSHNHTPATYTAANTIHNITIPPEGALNA